MSQQIKFILPIALLSIVTVSSACESSIQGETDIDFPEGTALVGEIVQAEGGAIQGEDLGDLVAFRSIPYAAPPVGPLRFASPEPHPGWTGTLNATEFGPICPQPQGSNVIGEEDCLSLSIWAPKTNTPLPVMFFIHGGAFTLGSGQDASLDGSKLARSQNVIVVTVNYRLGILGFLTSEALRNESLDGSVGNYGIQDQVAALEWVQSNITSFGGNPGQVTIFGESAGGVSVCSILGAPSADGLYDKAIIQSGGGCFGFVDPDEQEGAFPSRIERHATMIASAGCSNVADELDCLQNPSTSIEALFGAVAENAVPLNTFFPQPVLDFSPVIDGVFLPKEPLQRIAQNEAPNIPIITGSNADEATLFTLGEFIPSRNELRTRLRDAFGDNILAEQFLELYPASEFPNPKNAFDALVSDFAFICPTETFSQVVSNVGGEVYNYHFAYVPPPLLGLLGATHGMELFFIFDNFPGFHFPSFSDFIVTIIIQHAWGDFARTGRPGFIFFLSNFWPEFSTQNPSFYVLNNANTTIVNNEIRSGRCEEIRNLGLLP